MAQWKSGPYDIVYHLKLEAALRLLRSAADAWALRGAEALSVDGVLAVLIRVFAARWSQYDWGGDRAEQVRRLDEWLLGDLGSPHAECARLEGRLHSASRVTEAAAELRGTLADAVTQWVAGNPEEPPTEDVLRRLATTLFRHRLLRRPPPAHLDDW